MKREYIWISTNANKAGTVAVVMAHHKTAEQAKQYAGTVEDGGYEGPVQKDMYPVGKEIALTQIISAPRPAADCAALGSATVGAGLLPVL